MAQVKVRSAEKSRSSSSCSLADRIAEASINAFQRNCPLELQNSYKQTVLSAVLLQVPILPTIGSSNATTELKVVSLGVGTKVLSFDQIVEEKGSCLKGGDKRLRDMHAEVLARRGFKKYLLEHITKLAVECEAHLNLNEFVSKHNKSENSVFRINCNGDGKLSFSFNSNIKVHLYSSSQPCGNACIKKWAKSKSPQFRSDLTPDEYPSDPHEPFFVTAKTEGQIALLFKRNTTDGDLKSKYTLSPDLLPGGTAFADTTAGNVMTCSDKLARWNVLGLQGSFLSTIFQSPIYLDTITIGRKFSKIHCQRAFCCRLQSFGSVCSGSFSLHHPVIMGTAVKFDNSIIITDIAETKDECRSPSLKESEVSVGLKRKEELISKDEIKIGAQFDEFRCFACWMDSSDVYTSEILDGHTGYLQLDKSTDASSEEEKISQLSSSKLATSFLHLQQLCSSEMNHVSVAETIESYAALKQMLSPDYQTTKFMLMRNGKGQYFDEWTKKNLL